MEDEFKKLITEGEDCVTFIHRTFFDSVPRIFRRGLVCGANIRTTATMQPRDYGRALELYNSGNAHGDMVVVIQIPSQLWKSVHEFLKGEEIIDDRIGYIFPGQDFAVKPGFVIAAIDKRTKAIRYNLDGWRRYDD